MDEMRIRDSKRLISGKSTAQLREMMEPENASHLSPETVEAARRILNERGEGNEKKAPRPIFLGCLILLGGLVAAAQCAASFLISDEDLFRITDATLFVQREDGTLPKELKGKSEVELRGVIEQNRSAVLKETRKGTVRIGLVKIGLACVFFIIAWGVLTGTQNPSRRLGPVMGIILIVLSLVQWKGTVQLLKILNSLPGQILLYPDYAWILVMPLTGIACLLVPFFLKKESSYI